MSQSDFRIGSHLIKQNSRPFIIAEVAQAHEGSLGFAHSFIDMAAGAGADAIKFQTHIADAESTRDEMFRVNFSYEDATRYDYWRRMEFTFEQWEGLVCHAREKNLVFLSSCFSLKAVEWMRKLSVPAWKIGSGEITTPDLLSSIINSGEPVLLSTGLSGYDEISEAVRVVQEHGNSVGLFQCTTKYPCEYESVGLNVIDALAERFHIPVRLSDHSGEILPSVAAMARGAAMIEVHVAFHKSQFGPDTSSSVTPEQLSQIVDARNAIDQMLSNPVEKDNLTDDTSEMKRLFGKSTAMTGKISRRLETWPPSVKSNREVPQCPSFIPWLAA